MAKQFIKQITIEGREFGIELDTNFGSFETRFMGQHVAAKSLSELETKLRKVVRSVREPIPVTQITTDFKYDSELAVDCEIVGVHGGTNSLLIKINGKVGQRSHNLCRRFTPEEHAEFKSLCLTARRAKEAFDKFKAARAVSGRALLEELAAKERDQEKNSTGLAEAFTDAMKRGAKKKGK